MNVIRYYRDGRHWDCGRLNSPTCLDVETAIRRMGNYCFPIVELKTTGNDENANLFNICGGAGRWAIFQIVGEWQYEDPGGGDCEVRLWESDHGYFCMEKNILTDVEKVLRITKAFFDTGSYDDLDAVR